MMTSYSMMRKSSRAPVVKATALAQSSEHGTD
jgi:hypothetical protein